MVEVESRDKTGEQSAKQALLLAGISLFSEKGYASTPVREIVALAGVTKPVLYYYFQNKEGLFRAILDGAAQRQEELLGEASRMTGTVLNRILYLYRRIYEELVPNQQLFRMIHNLIFGPPQGAPGYDMEGYHHRMLQAVKAIYKQGLERGEVKAADPAEVAMMIVGVTDYCFHLDYLHPESADPARSERLLRLAFQGLAGKSNV
jgi:TetR/AcrR family transcriptional regulator